MAYVLRLIAAALLSGVCSAVGAQSCPAVGGDELLFNGSNQPSGVGSDYYCSISGCLYGLTSTDGGFWYGSVSMPCSSGTAPDSFYNLGNGENSGGGSGENNNPPNNGGGNNSGGEGGSGNGSGSGGYCDNGNCDSGSGENPGNGENPKDGDGEGDGEKGTGIGVPVGAFKCDKDDAYWHDCYFHDENSGDWSYWYKGDEQDICSPEENKKDWHKCYFDGKYYRKGYGNNEWDNYNDYRYERCKEDYDTDGFKSKDAITHMYCIQRYRGGDEVELYDAAVADFKNSNSSESGDDESKDGSSNEEIDISKKFGIVVHEDGSMSSTLEDILSYAKPKKSGKHGVCLDDIKIEMGKKEIVLEISRVCEWLEYLGTILLFISYFVAFQIIARD